MTDATGERRARHIPWHALGLILAVCVLAAALVWVGVRALMLKAEVDAIQSLTGRMSAAIADHDLDALADVNADLSDHTGRAVALSSDPLWTTAQQLPLIGDDLSAVRTAVRAADTISSDVVAPLLRQTSQIGDGADSGARLAAAVAAGGPLDHAATILHREAGRLSAIPTAGLVGPVRDGVGRLTDLIVTADETVQPLASSARALPHLLGTDQPQTILLMIQNPAELRTGGGITGTFVQLRAADGKLKLQKMLDSSAFSHRHTPILAMPDALTTLYSDVIGRFVQNSSIPADFTLTSRLATAWWTAQGGAEPDAVVSIDPIVMKAILKVTGPIRLHDGTRLTAHNLQKRLLVDPYMTMTSTEQSEFFAQVTTAMFTRLFAQGLSPLQWAEALAGPVQGGHISLWTADEATESAIASGPLGGPLARQKAAGDAAYAVYFNDDTGAKMATYMDTKITVADGVCREDGKHTVQVSVALTSTAPKDAASWPFSMNGGGRWGIPAGDIGMNVSVSAPSSAFVDAVQRDGKATTAVSAEASGHPTSVTHVTLRPGQTKTLSFRFVTTSDAAPTIVHTPMLTDPDVVTAPLTCH